MDGVRAGRLSRRELIAGTLGAGGVAALADATSAEAESADDGALLTAALTAEQVSVLAYEAVLTLPVLTADQRRLLGTLFAHERAHVRALERQLTALGRAVPAAPTDPAQVDQALGAHGMSGHLAEVRTVKEALQVLLDVGALCEGAYYTAIGKLAAPGPLVSAIQALASEAQHSALLAQALYGDDIRHAVPSWYVAGVR